MSVLRNFEPHEGTVSAITTIPLALRSRKILIINDSANDMKFKFNELEDFGTLRSSEEVSLHGWFDQVILNGNGAYRIWSWG